MEKTGYEDWLEVADKEGHSFWVKNTRLAVRADELMPYIQKFEDKVWNYSLRCWTEDGKTTWIRHSGTYGMVGLSLLYTCGRIVMTLKKDGNYLTLQGVGKQVGIHTMIGSVVDLAKMIEEVCEHWSLDNLNQDDKIFLI